MRCTESPVIRIQPTTGWAAVRLGELWAFRGLVYFFIWRDIKVRYKQTTLGIGWAILQPLFTMAVFSLFFGRLAHMPADGVPYPLFSLAALVPWTFFANGLSLSSNSLVGSSDLIQKVYFPRLVIPVATVLAGLQDFLFAFAVLLGIVFFYGVLPTWNILFLPVFVLLAIASSLGIGMWLSALNVEFRDIKYVVPFLTQVWLFGTPVAYPSSLLPEPWRTLYGLNPMVGVTEGFRWTLLGTSSFSWGMAALSTLSAFLLLAGGLLYFRRMERTFADVV